MIPINKEDDLFDYLRSSKYPDLVKARKQMSRWDCYSPDSSHRIELKCRTKHYEKLLIEKKKFDSMLEICQRHFDIPIYICSTPMGSSHLICWAFRLSGKSTHEIQVLVGSIIGVE